MNRYIVLDYEEITIGELYDLYEQGTEEIECNADYQLILYKTN